MPKCDFNKVASTWVSSPANLLHIFRTPSSKNTSGWLLLKLQILNLLIAYCQNYEQGELQDFPPALPLSE